MSLEWKLKKLVWRWRWARESKLINRELAELLSAQEELPTQHFRVGVYFADGLGNLYQMRQWYGPLRELNKIHPVLLFARSAEGAHALLKESGIPVAHTPSLDQIEDLLTHQPIGLMLYVNQNVQNFKVLRYRSFLHVFINHGESDKLYMVSNQLKAYDYSLIAGDAARWRLVKAMRNYDVDARTLAIGRPQTDYLAGDPPYSADGRTVVLYAPTWEGDRASTNYGSLVSHGDALVRRLLETGRHRLVYRPHPRTGVHDFAHGLASRNIKRVIDEANQNDPSAFHVVDVSPEVNWQISQTDIAICDISAVVYDRLATGRPLIVTKPTSSEVEVDETGYLGECDWLDARDALKVDEVIDEVLENDNNRNSLKTWSKHYFGDISPGAPTRRFHAAVGSLLGRAEEARL